MKLDGIHHITAITGDAPVNVKFYVGTLGLRLVKKTVNQDDPTVYHLFYADEQGSPGSDLTFFEYPNAVPGRAGAGMVHRICWRVGSTEALSFWERRLREHGCASERTTGDGSGEGLRFKDPEGLEHELLVSAASDEPLSATAPDIPSEMALQGFDGVRVYCQRPQDSAHVLSEVLGFSAAGGDDWEVRGSRRGGHYRYDQPPAEPAKPGAGTVHHVAFAADPEDEAHWQERIAAAGLRPTPVIDRFYFRSVYFREPSGVLMEIATIGPGFAVDEDPAHLGERLSLPPRFEPLRERLNGLLTPLPDPRSAAAHGS
ncbi:MAG TPA: ring-cleaving dioxygenase [Solirubrobacteraceae bacterium]